MRIVAQVALFLMLSLAVHMALAAFWQSKEPEVEMEQSIGGVALKIGSLIHSSRAMISPVEPVEKTAVEAKKVTKPIPQAEHRVVHNAAPKVIAKNALIPKEAEKQSPVKPARQKPEVTAAQATKPAEAKAPPRKLVQKPVTPPDATEKSIEAEKVAPVTSKVAQLRGGTVASSQGRENMITGTSGKKITRGGNAENSNYRGEVWEKLFKNKFYPKLAKRFKMEGVVVFAFTVRRNGQISALRVLTSSGSPMLDKAALRMVEISAPFGSFPPEIETDILEFRFPVSYTVQ